jgi:hypothetical protein
MNTKKTRSIQRLEFFVLIFTTMTKFFIIKKLGWSKNLPLQYSILAVFLSFLYAGVAEW